MYKLACNVWDLCTHWHYLFNRCPSSAITVVQRHPLSKVFTLTIESPTAIYYSVLPLTIVSPLIIYYNMSPLTLECTTTIYCSMLPLILKHPTIFYYNILSLTLEMFVRQSEQTDLMLSILGGFLFSTPWCVCMCVCVCVCVCVCLCVCVCVCVCMYVLWLFTFILHLSFVLYTMYVLCYNTSNTYINK